MRTAVFVFVLGSNLVRAWSRQINDCLDHADPDDKCPDYKTKVSEFMQTVASAFVYGSCMVRTRFVQIIDKVEKPQSACIRISLQNGE
ncbi:MAG: hypothetical protein ACKO5C_04845 [Ferruginibacter sp.]